MSRDRILKVLVLVLVLMPKVSVLVLVLKLGFGLGLGIIFWQVNKVGIIVLILKCNVKYNVKEKAIESVVTLCIRA